MQAARKAAEREKARLAQPRSGAQRQELCSGVSSAERRNIIEGVHASMDRNLRLDTTPVKRQMLEGM